MARVLVSGDAALAEGASEEISTTHVYKTYDDGSLDATNDVQSR